jgi:hypothetical protein
MTKHVSEMTSEEFDEWIVKLASQGGRADPVLVSYDIHKRIQKAIKEGAAPRPFSCSADAQYWLMEWENKS